MILQNLDALLSRIEAVLSTTDVLFLGICGPSNSGKTTLCKRIVQEFPEEAHHFNCDQLSKYSYAERTRRISNAVANGNSTEIEAEENPRHWYDWDGIGMALRDLKEKRAFSYPYGWNALTGKRDQTYAMAIPSTGKVLVLCDGIYLLNSPVRTLLDVLLFIDTPLDVAAERGRLRAQKNGNHDRADYIGLLNRTYGVSSYFAEHAKSADWLYSN